MSGRLMLVGTPIGNLGDLSARSVDALRSADVIACEDTRHSRKLLSAHDIAGKRLLAVHEHNERDAAQGLVRLASDGNVVALVTDAGMPGISDPGAVVVRAFLDAGLAVECLPGPSALLLALVVSGLPTERFVFEGFLPAKGPERSDRLRELADERRTFVLYEAPHRLARTVHDLVGVCGPQRPIAISRELTKRFEETWRGSMSEAVVHTTTTEPRGEYVIVVGGRTPESPAVISDESIRTELERHLAAGLRTRDAVDAVAATTGTARKRVYAVAISKPEDPNEET